MIKEKELELLKKSFKYSVKEVYTTSIVLRNEALKNPRRSLMEQLDLFGYTTDDVYNGVNILKDLLNEVSQNREAKIVLGCTNEMDDDEQKEVINEISNDIENLFNKLKNNEIDIAATSDDRKRRKDYDRLMKGFRVIADVLNKGNFSPDVVAATLVTIRDSSNHCLGNWKHILIGLMIQFEDQIECMIENKCTLGSKRAVINYEEDRIYNTIANAFYNSRKYVAEDITSVFIDEYIGTYDFEDIVYEEGNIAHYKGLCIDYLNDNYYLNIPQIDVEDDFLSDDVKEFIIWNFEEYIDDKSIDDLIYDRATQIIMDDIAKNPDKISHLMDWFNKYLDERKLNEVKKDKELVVNFFCKYITKGVYNQEIRYLAIREIMLYYGFIAVKALKNKIVFREDRIRQVLSDLGKDDREEKRRIITTIRKIPKIFINIANDPAFSYDDIWGSEKIRNIIKGFLEDEEALLYACEYKNTDIAKYLINNGALLDAMDEDGKTPLIIAYEKKSKDIVECLLHRGANINAIDFFGNTLLMLACERNDIGMVKYLVEGGVNVNVLNSRDDTALMIACDKNNTDIAKYLVENGAYVNIENKDGETALELACENNNGELMTCLVKNFASVMDLKRKVNVVKLLNNNLGREYKCAYSVYIQTLVVLDNIDWLRNMLGDLYYDNSKSPQLVKADWLSGFLDNYLNNSDLRTNELKNCVNFMDKERMRLMHTESYNTHMVEVLDEYITKIKDIITKRKTNVVIPREELQNTRGRERNGRSL